MKVGNFPLSKLIITSAKYLIEYARYCTVLVQYLLHIWMEATENYFAINSVLLLHKLKVKIKNLLPKIVKNANWRFINPFKTGVDKKVVSKTLWSCILSWPSLFFGCTFWVPGVSAKWWVSIWPITSGVARFLYDPAGKYRWQSSQFHCSVICETQRRKMKKGLKLAISTSTNLISHFVGAEGQKVLNILCLKISFRWDVSGNHLSKLTASDTKVSPVLEFLNQKQDRKNRNHKRIQNAIVFFSFCGTQDPTPVSSDTTWGVIQSKCLMPSH